MSGPVESTPVQHSGRILLFALLIICNLGLVADLSQQGIQPSLLVATQALRVLFFLGCAFELQRSPSGPHSLNLVSTFLIAQAIFASVIGDMRHMPETVLLGNGSLCLATAALVPWGWRRQSLLGLVVVIGWLVLMLIRGPADYPMQGGLLIFLLVGCSTALAFETRRDHLDFGQRLAQAVAARSELHTLNIELEARVAARTRNLEETSQQLYAFCQAISHDLRPPLRTIDGFNGLLLEPTEVQPSQSDLDVLNEVRAAAQTLGHDIDELLNGVRDAQALLSYAPVNLSTLVESSLGTLCQAKGPCKLRISVDPNLIILGESDAYIEFIDQICLYAWGQVENEAEPTIHFGVHVLDSGQRTFFLEDNGPGFDMSSENPLDPPTATAHQIHGRRDHSLKDDADDDRGLDRLPQLGLASAQRTLHEHAGSLWATSAASGGSTLFFTVADKDDTYPIEGELSS